MLSCLTVVASGCGEEDNEIPTVGDVKTYITASIGKTCKVDTSSFRGTKVYGSLKTDHPGFSKVLHVGGYDSDGIKEIVVNMAVPTGDIETGDYPIESNGLRNSWLLYYPTANESDAYISTGEGNVRIDRVEFVHNGDPSNFNIHLTEVKVANGSDTLVLCGNIERLYY